MMSTAPASEGVGPIASTLDVLSRILPARLLKPRVAIVCGSGLSTLASSLRDVVEVPYSSLEGFGKSTGMHRVLRVVRARVVHDSHR